MIFDRRRPAAPAGDDHGIARLLLQGILLAAALSSASVACPDVEAPASDTSEDRVIGITGASLSAGFGVHVEVPMDDGGDPAARPPRLESVRLRDLILAIAPPDTIVSDWSTAMMYDDPVAIGTRAIDRLCAAAPDAVLAIDFLFWFSYGQFDASGRWIVDERQRFELFEVGLDLLDRLDAPKIVGDLPDMRGASRRMLTERQTPSPATLARLNARLRSWAASRDDVRIVSLASMRRDRLRDGPELASRNLQADRLHPTFNGLVEILAECVPAFAAFEPTAAMGATLEAIPPQHRAARLARKVARPEMDHSSTDAEAPAEATKPVESIRRGEAAPSP